MSQRNLHTNLTQFLSYWLVTFNKVLNFSLNLSFLICEMGSKMKQSIAQCLIHNKFSINAIIVIVVIFT